MYKATQGQATASGNPGGTNAEGQPNADKNAENVTDAEFEEVK
jgi:hypothetical protein